MIADSYRKIYSPISRLYQLLYNLSVDISRPVDLLVHSGKWCSDVSPDFLIIGLQKSGTAWITALLRNHPEVVCIPSHPGVFKGTGEGHFFDILAEFDNDFERFKKAFSLKHKGFFRDLVKRTSQKTNRDDLFMKLSRRYNAFLQVQKRGRQVLVGDKTTEYVFHLDLINRFYPDMKKICILRDPRDRIVSFHFHQIRKNRLKDKALQMWEVED